MSDIEFRMKLHYFINYNVTSVISDFRENSKMKKQNRKAFKLIIAYTCA